MSGSARTAEPPIDDGTALTAASADPDQQPVELPSCREILFVVK